MFYIHSIVTYANLFESFYFTERTSKHGELAHKCDDIVCECICWTLYCWPFLVSLAKCKQCFCFKSVIRHIFFSSVWVTNETWNIFNKETNVKQRTEFHDFFFCILENCQIFFLAIFHGKSSTRRILWANDKRPSCSYKKHMYYLGR